ncbi:cell envelope integrity protein TolA [Chryseobacterium gambrini]|uniref:cell envelope integrity protein TolA n=1 Tax=Chryseobacterium gambrini TaxID=373672 RepID=UPI003BA42A16
MEKVDDEFGDLSGYKILSFEEVTQGFEGNKNPLQGIASKSFEEMSAFKNSLFGQYWEKKIHEWAKDIFGASKIIEKRNLTIADISKRVSYSQADAYGAFSDTSKYNFIVYAHPDGEEVIKMYEDPQNIPNSDRPFEVLVFIETDDGKFDFGKIVRVKFGPAVLDDLKDKYFRELPWNDNDPKDIAEEFIKRAWKASVSAQTVQAVEQEQNTPDFKDLMIKAIQYEYDNHKFDDFSWFMLIVKGGEYLDFSLPNWAFGIGHWLRTKKYKEDKYWNGDLPEKEYTPAFLPNSFFYDKQEDRVKSLKEYFHKPYDALKSEIDKKITHDDPVSKVVKKWLVQNIDECQKITDGYLENLAKIYIPDGSFQTIIKHYHAFYVGLYNGILEFVAGLCDLVAIVILILRDELGFRMTDKLTEKFENFVNDLFYNTFELLNKICKKLYKILLDFGKWYLTYDGKSYFFLKELGELVPDILTFLIPVLKGSKAAKIGAVVEKEAVEEAVEETIEKTVKETAEELTEQEAKQISQSAKEALESGKTKEATEQAVKEAEQKLEEKAPLYEEIKVNAKLKSKFSHTLSSGAVIAPNAKKGTYLVGGWVTDFRFVLKELDYPVITDVEILRKGYDFPLPKGQKFNLLNVSEDVVTYFSKKGGFFNRVNAKWVDAAVKRGEDVIIATDLEEIYRIVNIDGKKSKILTGYGKEVHRFEWKHGYRYDPESKMMLPPEKANGLEPLTKFEDYKMVD